MRSGREADQATIRVQKEQPHDSSSPTSTAPFAANFDWDVPKTETDTMSNFDSQTTEWKEIHESASKVNSVTTHRLSFDMINHVDFPFENTV